jgi:hypothetical protein
LTAEVVQVMARANKGSFFFAVLMLGAAAYFGAFIYRTSFVIDGERYFSLFDDAMVSMRYARNLANGHGLVWNPADRPVEGFTNPLWTFYMALPHLLPIAPSKRCLFIQVTSALLLLANLYFVKRIAEDLSDRSVPVTLAAVGLTAFYHPINNWSLQGMELGLLTLLVSIATWTTIRSIRTDRFDLRVYLLLGLATLVRPDMVVPFVATWAFLVVASPGRARPHLLAVFLILAASALGQTALRLWYFGDILPNTYYLKMTGYPLLLRLSRGAVVLGQFIWSMNPILFLMPLLLLSRQAPALVFPLWLLLVQMAYSVFVGGDAWEEWGASNRYLSIVMPGFFVVFACAAWRVSQLATPEPTERARTISQWVRRSAFPVLILLGLVTFNTPRGPLSLADVLLLRPPLHSGQGGSNMAEVRETLLLRAITTDKASIAVTRAGTIPYFTGRPAVDLLGKTDTHVAHELARVPSGLRRFVAFHPGHMKFDYDYSVGHLRPDVIAQLWADRDRVKPYLDEYYLEVEVEGRKMWLRRDSPNIVWTEVRRHGGRPLGPPRR